MTVRANANLVGGTIMLWGTLRVCLTEFVSCLERSGSSSPHCICRTRCTTGSCRYGYRRRHGCPRLSRKHRSYSRKCLRRHIFLPAARPVHLHESFVPQAFSPHVRVPCSLHVSRYVPVCVNRMNCYCSACFCCSASQCPSPVIARTSTRRRQVFDVCTDSYRSVCLIFWSTKSLSPSNTAGLTSFLLLPLPSTNTAADSHRHTKQRAVIFHT